MPTPLSDSDKVLRNDTGKSIASKLDDIKTAIQNQSSSLNNLSDVSISSPADKQALLYDGTENKWKNRAIAESDVTGLSTDLSGKMDSANPTGTGSLSLNRKANTTVGTNSVAVGTNCAASGSISCAIGDTNTASGAQSFAVGAANTASGERSTAMGSNTSASGSRSAAMGQGTIAQRKAQHVFGEYNVADTTGADGTVRGSYVEIVGKGTADNARSNARTLDWNGNETLAGDLIFNGSTSLTNKFIYEKTASGSIATFSDGGDNIPMKSCEVAIVAQQASGTPSPSNPLPITGFSSINPTVCGKNLFDLNMTPYAEKKYMASSVVGNTPTYTANDYYNVYAIKIKPNTKYSFGIIKANSPQWGTIDKDGLLTRVEQQNGGTDGTTITFTSQANDCYLLMSVCRYSTYKCDDILQVEQGIPTTYEPYTGTTTPVSLGQTIYGGTAELVGGNGTKKYKYFSYTEVLYYGTYGSDNANLYYMEIPDYTTEPIKNISNATYTGVLLSNMLSKISTASVSDLKNNEIRTQGNSSPRYFYFRADSFASLADLNTFLANTPLQVVAELETPTAFTFTGANIPTLSGVNNVYADSGDVDLEYFNENADEIAEVIRSEIKKEIGTTISGTDISSQFTPETGVNITAVQKFGKFIVITGATAKVTTANSFFNIGTFATGYKPTKTFTCALSNSATADFGYGSGLIGADGVVKAIYSKATTYGLYFSLIFIV